MASRLAKLLIKVTFDSTGLDKGLKTAASDIDALGRKMQAAGTRLTGALTAPLAAAGAVALKMAADFDKAFVRATANMGALSNTLRNDLEKTARAVGIETGKGARAAAEGYLFLASSGQTAEQSLTSLPVVARFATAGMLEMREATMFLTTSMGALGLKTKDPIDNLREMTRVSDVLTEAARLSEAEISDFAAALTNKAAAAMKTFNIPLEEGVAVLAAFATQGIKGEEAGEKFFIVLRELTSAALANAEGFRKLGVDVFDANRNVRPFADILEQVEVALEGASDAEKVFKLGLTGIEERSRSGLIQLIGYSKTIREMTEGLYQAEGATRTLAEKALANLSDETARARERLFDVAIQLGHLLVPAARGTIVVVNALSTSLGGLLSIFSTLPDSVQTTVIAVLALATAIGPFLLATSVLVRVLPILSSGFAALGTALSFLARNTLVLLVAGVYTAIAAFLSYGVGAENLREQTETLGMSQESAAARVRKLTDEIEKQRGVIAEAAPKIADIEQDIKDFEAMQPSGPVPKLGLGQAVELDKLEELREQQRVAEALVESNKKLLDVAKVEAAYVRFSQSLRQVNGEFRGTQNAVDQAQGQIDALKRLLKELGPVLEEDDNRLVSARRTLAELEKKVADLTRARYQDKSALKDHATATDEWRLALEEARVTGDALGSAQTSIQGRIQATETAIKAYTDQLRKQGEPADAIIKKTAEMRAELERLHSVQVLTTNMWSKTSAAVAGAGASIGDFLDRNLGPAIEEFIKFAAAHDETTRAMGSNTAAVFQQVVAHGRWRTSLQDAALLNSLVGQSQATLQDQISLTEQSIISYASQLLTQGASQGMVIEKTKAMREELYALQQQLVLSQSSWVQWGIQIGNVFSSVTSAAVAFGELTFTAFQGMAQGIGESLAQTLVFGESFTKGLSQMILRVAAQFIASLVAMGIQLVIFAVLSKVFGAAIFDSFVGASAGRTFAGAYASVIEGVSFPLNLVLAPIVAGTAVGVMHAGARAAAAFETGGMTKREGFAYLHPREVITPIDRIWDMAGMSRGAGGDRVAIFQVDGVTLATAVMKDLPRAVRRKYGNSL